MLRTTAKLQRHIEREHKNQENRSNIVRSVNIDSNTKRMVSTLRMKKSKKREISKEIGTEKQSKYYCEQCEKYLQTKHNLYVHNREQHSLKVACYECSKCNYRSKRRIDRDRHELNCFSEPCEYCGKVLRTTLKLRRHIEKDHKDENFRINEIPEKNTSEIAEI